MCFRGVGPELDLAYRASLRIAYANPVRKQAGDRIQLQFQIGTSF